MRRGCLYWFVVASRGRILSFTRVGLWLIGVSRITVNVAFYQSVVGFKMFRFREASNFRFRWSYP